MKLIGARKKFRSTHRKKLLPFVRSTLRPPPVFDRAFGCVARRGGAGTSWRTLGPDQARWRVRWASKVARAGSFSRDCVPPRRAEQGHGNPNVQIFLLALLLYLQYHTALKSYTLRQPRYNSSRASSSSLCNSHEWCICAGARVPS